MGIDKVRQGGLDSQLSREYVFARDLTYERFDTSVVTHEGLALCRHALAGGAVPRPALRRREVHLVPPLLFRCGVLVFSLLAMIGEGGWSRVLSVSRQSWIVSGCPDGSVFPWPSDDSFR